MPDEIPNSQEQTPPNESTPSVPETPPASTPSTETPPVVQQPPQIDSTLILAQRVIQEKNAEINNLQQRLSALEQQRNAPPPVNREDANKNFFDKPYDQTEQIVQQKVQEAIKPLNDMLRPMVQQNAIAAAKQQMKNNPNFAFMNLPEFEQAFDSLAQQNGITDPAQAQMLYGNMVSHVAQTNAGLLNQMVQATQSRPSDNRAPATPNVPPVNNQPRSPVTPPIVPPSANPMPTSTPKNPWDRPLTENEKMLARRNNMTEQQYLEEMNKAPEAVVIPIVPPGGNK